MKSDIKLNFQKGDIFAVIIVLLIAVCIGLAFVPFSKESQDAAVQIWQDGRLMKELPLDKNRSIEVAKEYHNVITIKDGKVSISESDCPGEDCVHSGWIGTVGRSIVCLPNRVEVRIVGSQDDVDFVVR